MSLDGKLGILIVTLAALFLIYLDNSGKLYGAMSLIAGPAIDDGAASQVAAISTPATTSTSSVPAGGVAPLPVTAGSIQPLPAGSSGVLNTITGINGAIPNAGSAVTGILAPYAPPLPSIVSGRRN